MNKIRMNTMITLRNLLRVIEKDEEFAEDFGREFDDFLDELGFDDFFGTEGQSDPRGDFRDGEWSIITEVQDQSSD